MGAASSSSSSVTRAPPVCATKHVLVKWAIGGVAYRGALDLSTAETAKLTCTDLLWGIRDSYGGQPPATLVLDVHLALYLTSAQGDNFARFVGCIGHAAQATGRVIEFVIHPPFTCPGYGRIRDGCLAFCTAHGIAAKWTVIPPPAPARITGAPGAPPRPGDDDDDDDDVASGNIAPVIGRAIQRADHTNPLERAAGYQTAIQATVSGTGERADQSSADIVAEISRRLHEMRRTIHAYYNPRIVSGMVLHRGIPGEGQTIGIFEDGDTPVPLRDSLIRDQLILNGNWHIDLFFMIMHWSDSKKMQTDKRMAYDITQTLADLRVVLAARYIEYVLHHMEQRDARVWFVISRPFEGGLATPQLQRHDFDEHMRRIYLDISAILGVRTANDLMYFEGGRKWAKVRTILRLVYGAIDDAIDGLTGRDALPFHLNRLWTAIWWIFCTHHRADYTDVLGERVYNEYIDEEDQRMQRRRPVIARGEQPEQVRAPPYVGPTELRYDLEVKDTVAPVDEEPCVVCLDNRRIITAMPCTHKVTCGVCSAFVVERMRHLDSGLHPCPMCRTPILYFEIRSETNQ